MPTASAARRLGELLAAVTGWCAATAISPTSMSTKRRSLQDVFLEMTGKELRP